jgi:hypothetical protein
MKPEQHIVKWPVVSKEIRKKIKKFWESNKKLKHNLSEPLGYSKDCAEKKIYSFPHLYKKKVITNK